MSRPLDPDLILDADGRAYRRQQSTPPARSTLRLGKLVLSTCRQAAGAPIVDECSGRGVTDDEPFEFSGWAVHLSPWRRDRWKTRKAGLALVVGIVGRVAIPKRAARRSAASASDLCATAGDATVSGPDAETSGGSYPPGTYPVDEGAPRSEHRIQIGEVAWRHPE